MSGIRTSELSNYKSVFLVVGMIGLLFLGKVLLIPLAFALTLCFLLSPAVSWLEVRRIPRAIAVALVSVLTSVVVLLILYVLSLQVLQVAQTLPGYRSNMQKRIAALHSPTEAAFEKAIATLEEMSGGLAPSSSSQSEAMPVEVVGRNARLAAAGEMIAQAVRPVGEVVVVAVFAIYMIMKREELRHRLLMLAGMGHINLMTRALDDATARISKYLVLQFEVNASYGVIFGAGLYCIGVPNAILWGVLSGALRIVPYVGTTVGMIFPLIISIAVSQSWQMPLLVVGLFIALETTAANFVEPWLISSRTGISSLALLASAIFWATLWGWPGLVLSTPLTVCVVVIGRHVPQLSFLHSLLGTNAQLSPAAHFYERLLATDQAEASAIAERYLDGKPLVSLYDSVLIPALSRAEEDRHKGALDQASSNFILLSMGELVARLTGYRQRSTQSEERPTRSPRTDTLQFPVKEFAVVCVSAGDQADKLTTVMLTQLLERSSYQTILLPADALSDEILKGLAAERNTVIFISALPPFAFAEVRSICQRIRRQLTENRIAVGFWNSFEDGEEMLGRFGSAQPDVVVGTLAQAMRQVGLWRKATRVA
ncbi:AI-2E family transporter [Granulicella sp. dw_53]|uniref:AI-2E family transporter n=1 Tax=Granulicella sp. dw_53 TaxID=2719792 RepID=UPI001BD5B4CD|nr:AI-2E family transporter [Granulicella sp. dw_53]